MSKKVVLVGHCGADSSYLKLAVKAAEPTVQILSIESTSELTAAMSDGVDLVLVNRVLDYGFESEEGVELIRAFHKGFPTVKMMLVSNFDSAQKEAIAAGALPGFGKREIGTPKVKELLKNALHVDLKVA
ncbi:hypothetical protein BH10PLA1_BH10PLA1_22090 [soil metagenome]